MKRKLTDKDVDNLVVNLTLFQMLQIDIWQVFNNKKYKAFWDNVDNGMAMLFAYKRAKSIKRNIH